MPLQRAALYLLMQFEDVVCQCQQNGLTQDIRTPSRKKAAKSKGSLDLCKDTLCLDAAVHPQDDSFRALDPCKVLCTLSLKDLGDLQSLGSFLHWYLAVVAMDALLLSFAAIAVCTASIFVPSTKRFSNEMAPTDARNCAICARISLAQGAK